MSNIVDETNPDLPVVLSFDAEDAEGDTSLDDLADYIYLKSAASPVGFQFTFANPDQTAANTPDKDGEIPGISRAMTYEDYIHSGIEKSRYDIIDGWKWYYNFYNFKGLYYVAGDTLAHNRLVCDIGILLNDVARQSGEFVPHFFPHDILISREPFRTRQSPVYAIGKARYHANDSEDASSAWNPAPELVIEIINSSIRRPGTFDELIADYRRVNVLECWVVDVLSETVTVLNLTLDNAVTEETYRKGDTVVSRTFANLHLKVGSIFTQEEDF